MDTKKLAETEGRPLHRFIKDKLGVNKTIFCELEGIPARTLEARWNTPAGRQQIIESVFRRYVFQFEGL